ncbi:hypothetical protein B0H13DRAFT_2056570, partial [Mycena leptocephala]
MLKVWIFSPADISPPVADDKRKEVVLTAHQRRAERQASPRTQDRLGPMSTLACLPPQLGAPSSSLPVRSLRGASIARPRCTARRRYTRGRMPVRKDIERKCSHRTRHPPIEEERWRCVVRKKKFVHSSAPSAEIKPSTDDRQGQRGRGCGEGEQGCSEPDMDA